MYHAVHLVLEALLAQDLSCHLALSLGTPYLYVLQGGILTVCNSSRACVILFPALSTSPFG